jgi:Ca2+-binding EF-hand superfamily protein
MDGVISDEEAAMVAEHIFARIDEDRNETLSEAEFTTPPRRGMRGWLGLGSNEAQAVIDVRKAKFATLDADKNAGVSKAEFFAAAKARLAATDTDKDGKVTTWEFRAMPRG